MDKPTVRAVHRVVLPRNCHGEITVGHMFGEVQPFPHGAAVVLECGEGWWARQSELERISVALSNVGHISVTGTDARRGDDGDDFGTVYGLDAIARRLDELIGNPRLFETA